VKLFFLMRPNIASSPPTHARNPLYRSDSDERPNKEL